MLRTCIEREDDVKTDIVTNRLVPFLASLGWLDIFLGNLLLPVNIERK